MGLIVLDTTVLVYAAGGDHPLHDTCLDLLDRVRARRLEATTTVEVIQEFAHVRARCRSRQDATGLARNLARLLAPLLSPTTVDLIDGLALFESRAEGSFDGVLAVVCLRRSMTLASADRAFASVPGLSCVVPGAPEFDALLD